MSYEFTGGHKIRDQYATHFMTFTIVGWIDLFSRKVYRDVVIDSMMFCREHKKLLVGAFVIMSNHVHVIWSAGNGNLSDIVRDFKTFCSKEFYKIIHNEPESRKEWLSYMFGFYANKTNQNKDFKIWQSGSCPEEITSEKFLRQKLNYIHDNPVRSGLVNHPEDYIYSSASNYNSGKGVMDIDYLF